MAGTKAGAQKAHQTKLSKDPEFYRKIGRQSWKNDRDHNVGFAKLDKEIHKEVSSRGGKKTKKDYQKKELVHEDVRLITGIGE